MLAVVILHNRRRDNEPAVEGRQTHVGLGHPLFLNELDTSPINVNKVLADLQDLAEDALCCPKGVLVWAALHSRQARQLPVRAGVELNQSVTVTLRDLEDH